MPLKDLKLIVVPWDYSEMAMSSLKQAMELAAEPSSIHVIHVAQIPMSTDPVFVWGAITEDTMAVQAKQAFEKQIEGHPELKGIKFATVFGDPGTLIADYAKDNKANLIVISSHGRTGMSRLLLGSVAERVLRLAHCPVLVLRD